MNRRLIPVAGGLLAAGIALGSIVWLSHRQTADAPTVSVFAVTTAEPQGTLLTSDMVAQESVAPEAVPAGALTSASAIVGNYAAVDLTPKEIYVPSLLVSTSPAASGGATGTAPVNIGVKDGDVVMNIPTDLSIGEAGYISANDRIDIIVDTTGFGTVEYFLQDVRVVRAPAPAQAAPAPTNSGGNAAPAPTSAAPAGFLLVEVSRYEAKELSLMVVDTAANASKDVPAPHILRYVLRPRDQQGTGDLPSGPPTTPPAKDAPVTPATLQALFRA